jgi:hypothetical protein
MASAGQLLLYPLGKQQSWLICINKDDRDNTTHSVITWTFFEVFIFYLPEMIRLSISTRS